MTVGLTAIERQMLELLLRRLGPAGRIVRQLIAENERLREENRRLADAADMALTRQGVAVRMQRRGELQDAGYMRPMKRRSPASWRFRVLRWEEGEGAIFPRDMPDGKVVPVLRIHVPLEDKPEDVPYWDITSKTLIAMLRPLLPRIVGTDTYVSITKDGEGRGSRYSVALQPA